MKTKVFEKEGLSFIEVTNNLGLKVVLCALGASIYHIYDKDVCLTRNAARLEDFKGKRCYYGKTIGRTANRIKGNKIVVEGQQYILEDNENGNVLHGGVSGLSTQVFTYFVEEGSDIVRVRFTYKSPHLESGYPGNLDVSVDYYVYKDINKIEVHYEATTDRKTLCSFTNHAFFTLGSSNISELSLKMNSGYFLDVDDEKIAKGPKEVPTFMDFRSLKPLPKDGGIDHFFYIDDRSITLENKKYRLKIDFDFEGAQIYTSNGPAKYELFPACEKQFHSVAIEPSDSHLNLHFLEKGEKYQRTIVYNIERI